MTILLFRFKETKIQDLMVIIQVPKLLVTTSYRMSGEVTLRIHNASTEAKLLSYKTCLVGIFLYPGTNLSWDTSVQDEKMLENHSTQMSEW